MTVNNQSRGSVEWILSQHIFLDISDLSPECPGNIHFHDQVKIIKFMVK